MKRFLIFMFLLFPFIVKANQNDKFYIDEYSSTIRILSDKKIEIDEKFKTKLIYGETSNTYFFIRDIGKTFKHEFNNKREEYKVEFDFGGIDTNLEFEKRDENDAINFTFGKNLYLLREVENIGLKYNVIFDKTQDIGYSYFIGKNSLETKKTKFTIYAPYFLNDKKVYFSLDGKNFSENLDGLSLNIKNGFEIEAEYNKLLKKEEAIYFTITDVNLKQKTETKVSKINYIVIVIVSLVLLILLFVLKQKRDSR